MSYAHHLREARAALIPQVPALAPHLGDDPEVVKCALHAQLDAQGADIAAIAPLDLNKAERHIFSGFGALALRELTVDGTDREASFREFTLVNKPFLPLDKRFLASIRSYQKKGLQQITDLYAAGEGAEGQWWPLAKQRYRQLGFQGFREVGFKIPLDGILLDVGVTVTMKCPANSSGGSETISETTKLGSPPTNLRILLHAAVNGAYEHGAFGGLSPAWNFSPPAPAAIQINSSQNVAPGNPDINTGAPEQTPGNK